MQFNYSLFLLSGLVFGSQASTQQSTQKCKPGQYYTFSYGVDHHVWDTIMKPRISLSERPKNCGEETTRCGEKGKLEKCVDDKWVKVGCPCPGLTCGKGAMFTECRGTPSNKLVI